MSEAFRVNILTIFPEMFESFFSASILGILSAAVPEWS